MEARSTLAVICLAVLFSPSFSHAQDEATDYDPQMFGIDLCGYLSGIAKDIMIARQDREPMSEVLPNAFARLSDFPDGVEGQTGELLQSLAYVMDEEPGNFLSKFRAQIKSVVKEQVKRAYDVPIYSTAGSQRDAISDFENGSFESCYEGFEENFGPALAK